MAASRGGSWCWVVVRLGEEEEVEAREEGKSAGATVVPSEAGGAVEAKEGKRIGSC